jgi:hypothetical protein
VSQVIALLQVAIYVERLINPVNALLCKFDRSVYSAISVSAWQAA